MILTLQGETIMNQLTRFDTQSLNRALIGFDQIFNNFERRFANQVQNNYPPHNVLKTGDNDYVLEVAVTGFTKDEITVEVDQDQLTVRAIKARTEDASTEYLHRGLATRDFDRSFQLSEHMVVGDAKISDGLLRVFITRVVPEALKPRLITVTSAE